MPQITLDLLRRRAEHNQGLVATLEEVSLHGQDIERIDLLAQACRHLKILYLQNNVIGRIENLHKLKELEYLNLALNNITLVENLAGCEALQKLDLTANFIAAPRGLLSVASLSANRALTELFLTGNPCEKADGYRLFVLATLPQLTRLDGTDVTPAERIAAAQALPALRMRLEVEFAAADASGQAAGAEGLQHDADDVASDTWGPEARLREHLEAAAERQAKEKAKRDQAMRLLSDDVSGAPPAAAPLRTAFDALPPDGALPPQKNEGGVSYTLEDSADGGAVVLTVAVGRFLDTADVMVDVQPRLVRCIIRGRLLQVHTPEEVRPGDAACQRSKTTGALVVTMPKATAVLAPQRAAPAAPAAAKASSGIRSLRIVDGDDVAPGAAAAPVPHAKITAVYGDDDEPPPLTA